MGATEAMRQRRRFGINNGLVIMERNTNHNFMMTLATGHKKFNARDFYLEYVDALNTTFADLKSIISHLPIVQSIISQNGDAKL